MKTSGSLLLPVVEKTAAARWRQLAGLGKMLGIGPNVANGGFRLQQLSSAKKMIGQSGQHPGLQSLVKKLPVDKKTTKLIAPSPGQSPQKAFRQPPKAVYRGYAGPSPKATSCTNPIVCGSPNAAYANTYGAGNKLTVPSKGGLLDLHALSKYQAKPNQLYGGDGSVFGWGDLSSFVNLQPRAWSKVPFQSILETSIEPQMKALAHYLVANNQARRLPPRNAEAILRQVFKRQQRRPNSNEIMQ